MVKTAGKFCGQVSNVACFLLTWNIQAHQSTVFVTFFCKVAGLRTCGRHWIHNLGSQLENLHDYISNYSVLVLQGILLTKSTWPDFDKHNCTLCLEESLYLFMCFGCTILLFIRGWMKWLYQHIMIQIHDHNDNSEVLSECLPQSRQGCGI